MTQKLEQTTSQKKCQSVIHLKVFRAACPPGRISYNLVTLAIALCIKRLVPATLSASSFFKSFATNSRSSRSSSDCHTFNRIDDVELNNSAANGDADATAGPRKLCGLDCSSSNGRRALGKFHYDKYLHFTHTTDTPSPGLLIESHPPATLESPFKSPRGVCLNMHDRNHCNC